MTTDPSRICPQCPRPNQNLYFDQVNDSWHCPVCGYRDKPLGSRSHRQHRWEPEPDQ